jgi:hypothetical protein
MKRDGGAWQNRDGQDDNTVVKLRSRREIRGETRVQDPIQPRQISSNTPNYMPHLLAQ